MQKFVLIVVVVLTTTAIPCVFGDEVELPILAVQCMGNDIKIFKFCEASQNVKELADCSEKHEKEVGTMREAMLSEKCIELKEVLTPEQLAEYFRRLKENITPQQIQILADVGY